MSVRLLLDLYFLRASSTAASSCSMTTSLSLMNSAVLIAERFLLLIHTSLYTSMRLLMIDDERPGYVSSIEITITEDSLPERLMLSLLQNDFAAAMALDHEILMSLSKLSILSAFGWITRAPTGVWSVSPRFPLTTSLIFS